MLYHNYLLFLLLLFLLIYCIWYTTICLGNEAKEVEEIRQNDDITTGPIYPGSKKMNLNPPLLEVNVFLISPSGCYGGLLTVTVKEIYFLSVSYDNNNNNNNGNSSNGNSSSLSTNIDNIGTLSSTLSNGKKVKRRKWNLSSISAVYLRRYRLRDTALEVFFTKGKHRSFFLDFGSRIEDSKRRNEFIKEFIKHIPKSSFKQLPELSPQK